MTRAEDRAKEEFEVRKTLRDLERNIGSVVDVYYDLAVTRAWSRSRIIRVSAEVFGGGWPTNSEISGFIKNYEDKLDTTPKDQ